MSGTEPTAECQSCLGFRIAWAATNAEELTPLADSEQMLAEAHHDEIAALRAEIERLREERDALFDEAKTATAELDARDGPHWAHTGYESIERWRAYHATLKAALKEAGP